MYIYIYIYIYIYRERSCTYGVDQNEVHILTATHIMCKTYTIPYHIPTIWTRLAFARYAHGFLRSYRYHYRTNIQVLLSLCISIVIVGVTFDQIGATYCTPEIDTSEIIVNCQWHVPINFQWQFQTDLV